MARASVSAVLCGLLALLALGLLPACGKVCTGCGTSCPDLKKTYPVTLLSLSFCKVIPTFTDTLAQLTVLREEQSGAQTDIALELSSLAPAIDVGLTGNLCAPSGASKELRLDASLLQQVLETGASTTYTLVGSFAVEEGKEPTVSGSLTISYVAAPGASDGCTSQVSVSPL